MAVATFDTLKFANTLKASGVPEKQAEAQAVAFAEVMQVNFKELVTKEDLNATRDELKQKINDLRVSVKQEINDVEQRLNAKIDNAVSDLKVQIAQVKGEQILLRWMMGATFASGLAALGLLVRVLFVLPR
jgi:polyhydroxyalkanoate synthesis regulator phasin